jgi:hypothetical protein
MIFFPHFPAQLVITLYPPFLGAAFLPVFPFTHWRLLMRNQKKRTRLRKGLNLIATLFLFSVVEVGELESALSVDGGCSAIVPEQAPASEFSSSLAALASGGVQIQLKY